MQANNPKIQKPVLSLKGKKKSQRYKSSTGNSLVIENHLGSLYKILRTPIYGKLIALKKEKKPKILLPLNKSIEEFI
jgi:hypothetical protein